VSVTASADGSFELTIRRDGDFVLLCEAQGHPLAEAGPFELDPVVGRDGVEIRVQPAGTIEGRVLVGPGREPAGVVVGINRFDGRPRTMRAGRDGAYRFEGLTPGAWSVTRAEREIDPGSSNSAYGWGDVGSRFATNCVVEPGSTTVFDLDLRGEIDTALVAHVTVDGTPAVGWTVVMTPTDVAHYGGDPPSRVVDAQGDARVVLPRPATYGLELVPPSASGASPRLARDVVIAGGDNPFAADLACGALAGTVTFDTSRMRLEVAAVGEAEWKFEGTIAIADGTFALAHVPVGTLRLTLRDEDWSVAHEEQVVIERGATARVEIR
jgi:hypothetical protein